MDQHKLQQILDNIRNLHVAVVGDSCLDLYWHADMTRSELSRETPHFPLPVTHERQFLGAGSNVAANAAALGSGKVDLLTVIGEDWRGYEWLRIARAAGISTEFVIRDGSRITPAYCKPMRRGISNVVYEDPRIDFLNHHALTEEVEQVFLSHLQALSAKADVFIISDQFMNGVITQPIRQAISELAKNRKVFVDSRDRISSYKNAVLKPNELELFTAVRQDAAGSQTDDAAILLAAQTLHRNAMAPVCVTLGDRGVLWVDDEDVQTYPAMEVSPPIDIVGAGDAFMAAMASSFGTDASKAEAVTMGTMAATIAIQKIGMAGVVSREELLALAASETVNLT